MGKIISAYSGFTAIQIKERASIPAQDDMTIDGDNIDCINISISGIHNAIQSSQYALSSLNTSPRVNKWSCFGPTEFYADAGVCLNRAKTPYTMGCWAGYNHNAVAPYLTGGYSTSFTFNFDDTEKLYTFPDIWTGEMDVRNSPIGANQVLFLVKTISGTIVGSTTATLYGYLIGPGVNINVSGLTETTILHTEFKYSKDGGAEICNVPNVSGWNITAELEVTPYINITNTSTTGTITQILVNDVETIGLSYEHGSQRYTTLIGTYTIKVVILDLGNGGNIRVTDSASTATCKNYAGGDISNTSFLSCVVNGTTEIEVVVSDGNCA